MVLIGLISNALVLMYVNPFYQKFVIGLVMIAAVAAGALMNRGNGAWKRCEKPLPPTQG